MEENKCFVLYKVSSVMIWTRANINPQSCLHAVNTLWVHWASTEDPERDLVPRVAKTSCSVGCSPYLVFFPNSPASGWCEGVTPQFPQSFYPWVPREKSCAPGVPCSSRSLWLDTFLPSLNSDPVFPESAPLLPWLAVWLLSIQLWSHQVIPPLHISGRPGL